MVTPQQIHKIIDPDLMKYPISMGVVDLNQWYTIGDLHGNPVKLLYFMIAIGAVTMAPADYEAYANFYINYTAPDKTTFDAMEALLAKVAVLPGASIRLIGDEFADRGRDDALTLSLISRFISAGGIIESILSNHTAVFIKQMESALLGQNNFIERFKQPISLPEGEINELVQVAFYCSLFAMRCSIIADIVKPDALIKQYHQFTHTLKVFSYDYPEEFNGEPVTYSHAGMSWRYIAIMRSYLSDMLTQQEKDVGSMLPVIDAINRVLNLLKTDDSMTSLMFDPDRGNIGTILLDMIQNRDDPQDDYIRNTHGHCKETFGLRTSLDTACGMEIPRTQQFIRSWDRKPPGYTTDLLFTKTYKIPELAKKAYAERVGVATVVNLSGNKRPASPDNNNDNDNNNKRCCNILN